MKFSKSNMRRSVEHKFKCKFISLYKKCLFVLIIIVNFYLNMSIYCILHRAWVYLRKFQMFSINVSLKFQLNWKQAINLNISEVRCIWCLLELEWRDVLWFFPCVLFQLTVEIKFYFYGNPYPCYPCYIFLPCGIFALKKC